MFEWDLRLGGAADLHSLSGCWLSPIAKVRGLA